MAEEIVGSDGRRYLNAATRGRKKGALLDHAYISSQLRGSLVAALLAEQKTTEPDDGLLRFVQSDSGLRVCRIARSDRSANTVGLAADHRAGKRLHGLAVVIVREALRSGELEADWRPVLEGGAMSDRTQEPPSQDGSALHDAAGADPVRRPDD